MVLFCPTNEYNIANYIVGMQRYVLITSDRASLSTPASRIKHTHTQGLRELGLRELD